MKSYAGVLFAAVCVLSGGGVKAAQPTKTVGYVAYSVINTRDQLCFQTFYAYVLSSDKNYDMAPEAFFCSGKPAFQTESGPGHIVVKALPPGDYEVKKIDATLKEQTSWHAFVDISVKFSVKPDVVTYIGEFTPEVGREKNRFGVLMPRWVNYTSADQYQRDLPLIEAKIPKGVPVIDLPAQ